MLLNKMLADEVLPHTRCSILKTPVHQWRSVYWGAWGKERYTFSSVEIETLHDEALQKFLEDARKIPLRLQYALNFSYGLTDLKGYSNPIKRDELDMLHEVYEEASVYASALPDEGTQFLIRELFCIRKMTSRIPGFTDGKLVNETDDDTTHRQYAYLDFFKFSLINLLIRAEATDLKDIPPQELAAYLVLSWIMGTGSFIEKSSVFFSEQDFQKVKSLCEQMHVALEEKLEYPACDFILIADDFHSLTTLISSTKNLLSDEEIISTLNINRRLPAEKFSSYYRSFRNLPAKIDESKHPVTVLQDLSKKFDQSLTREELISIKQQLRNAEASLERRYEKEWPSFREDMQMVDFFDKTTHPFFTGLLLEGKMLAALYKKENADDADCNSITTLFNEFFAFWFCFKTDNDFSFDSNLISASLPRLVLAHHVHNANTEKLKDMMTINRLMNWPVEKQVLNISTSSSNVAVVRGEREICLAMGFNHYRIHARQHLKAGNQNRSIFNAINCHEHEYYLTLDDDYFIFPKFPLLAHQHIFEGNFDYYQAPLAFKGVYKLGALYGEKTDAEIMHYFESTSGQNQPRTYIFPRGTGTVFSFHNGISSIGDTGGFLINHSSEDFGQGFLSLLQDYNIKGKKVHTHEQGVMSEQVMCIGEGVDLSGKLMQMIRWCHGTAQIYFHILLPAIIVALLKGEFNIFMNKQVRRVLLFVPVAIASKLLTVVLYVIPLLYYLLLASGTDMSVGISKSLRFNAEWIFIAGSIFLMAAVTIHYYIVQKRFSFSPIRIFLMENMIMMSATYGYITGMFGLRPVWWSNKTRKMKFTHYLGALIIFIVNIVVSIFAYRDGFMVTAGWALFNASVFCAGFVCLVQQRRISIHDIRIPLNLFNNVFKSLSVMSVVVFATYIVIRIIQTRWSIQWVPFSIVLVTIVNLLLTLAILFIYILKEKTSKKLKA
jgi:hypothetical protein